MIGKPLDQVAKTDIEALQTNGVQEGRTIDYKLTLPGNTDGDKKEFLADVSSFANATGGDLIFGVVEEGGVPVDIPGLDEIDPDAEVLRLEQIIRAGLEPRVPGVQAIAIRGFPNGPVLVLRMPNSWASPHMVTFKGTSRFFTRSSAGKYPMDVSEIRSAFVLSEGLPERIRAFRDERLGKIVAGTTPMLLRPAPVLVLHLLPLSSLATQERIDIAKIGDRTMSFPTINGGGHHRYNIDGMVTTSGSCAGETLSRDYCQVFRSGRVESVCADIVWEQDGTAYISSGAYERHVVEALEIYVQGLTELGFSPPLICLMSMVGVKDVHLATGTTHPRGAGPIDRDMLLLPDVIFEDDEANVPNTMRPVFDAVWNACGYPRSFNYDENGNWKTR